MVKRTRLSSQGFVANGGASGPVRPRSFPRRPCLPVAVEVLVASEPAWQADQGARLSGAAFPAIDWPCGASI